MNTEFNIADLEKALATIKANPLLETDDPELRDKKTVTPHLFELLFIEGAKTLAVSIADGLTESEILKRINEVRATTAMVALMKDVVPDSKLAVTLASEMFGKIGA